MTLEERVGVSWARELKEFFSKPDIKHIAGAVSKERKIKEVYPAEKDVFRAFRETPFDTIKVVWLGQDPYNDVPGQATGLAFDCGKYLSPSMKKVGEVYDKEYPKHFNIDVMEGKLLRWAHQGVFLLNASLTVAKKEPNSHARIWKPFTQYVINRLLYDGTPKVFVGLGKFAQELIGEVYPPHKLLKYEHPAAACYDRRDWQGDGIFHKINDILKYNNLPEIDW